MCFKHSRNNDFIRDLSGSCSVTLCLQMMDVRRVMDLALVLPVRTRLQIIDAFVIPPELNKVPHTHLTCFNSYSTLEHVHQKPVHYL